MPISRQRLPGTSVRRRMSFGLLAIVLAYGAFAWQAHLAFLSGAPSSDMDWDEDGVVSSREILQSWYAVSARLTQTGARSCRTYYWRGQSPDNAIRVSCKTEPGKATTD